MKRSVKLFPQPNTYFSQTLNAEERKIVACDLRLIANGNDITPERVVNGRFGTDAFRCKHTRVRCERGGTRSIFRIIGDILYVIVMKDRCDNPYGDGH